MANLGLDDKSKLTGTTFRESLETFKGTTEYSKIQKEWIDNTIILNDLNDAQARHFEKLVERLGDVLDNFEEINEFLEDSNKLFDYSQKSVEEIRNVFSDIVADIRGSKGDLTDKLNTIRGIRNISGEIVQSLEIENGASQTNLHHLTKKAQKAQESYEWQIRRLTGEIHGEITLEGIARTRERVQEEIRNLNDQIQDRLTNRAKLEGDLRKKSIDQRENIRRQIKDENDRIKVLNDKISLQKVNLELLSEENRKNVANLVTIQMQREELGKEVRRKTAGVGFVAGLAEKVGIAGSKDIYETFVQKSIKYSDITSQVENAKATGASEEEIAKLMERQVVAEQELVAAGGNRLGVLKLIGKQLFTNLTALGLALKIWQGLKDVSSEVAKLQQNIGKFRYEIAATNFEFASSKQYLETANELVQQFGQNPISFIGEKEIAQLAEAKNLLGLTAEQAGNVGIRSKIAGQNVDQYNDSIVQGINEGNALNRSAVAHGLAMKEVLATSDDITLSLGNNGEALGRAIVAAKNLGMSLKDIDNIANQLLNFESSIENEMKAQLLTGNQMNLSRARALALQNNLEGVAVELTKQNITAAKFGEMNRIQQESVASALGMSREQLGKMLVEQAGISKLTDKQIEAATGVKREQLEAMGMTERWKVATDKLAQAFTPLLEILVPIVSGISKAVTFLAGLIGKLGTTGQLVAVLGAVAIRTLIGISRAGAVAGAGLGRFFSIFKVGTLKAMKQMPRLFKSLGRGIGALGKGAAAGVVGVPAILGIAAGVALLGGAVWLAGKGIEFLGKGIRHIVTGFADLFKSLVNVDLKKIMAIGPAFLKMGAGMLLALPGLVGAAWTLKPITSRLIALAKSEAGIQKLAGSVIYLASAIGILKTNLSGLEVKNLEAVRKEAVKAVNSIDSGRLEAVSAARQIPAVQASVRETATRVESEKTEKLIEIIANKVSNVLQVEVVNLDWDKIGRQLATQTTQG